MTGSNRRPTRCKRVAIPAEIIAQIPHTEDINKLTDQLLIAGQLVVFIKKKNRSINTIL